MIGVSPLPAMKLSLRTKIMGMIVFVGALLLLLALFVVWCLGYKQRVAEQGGNFQSEAAYLAESIRGLVDSDISKLNDLVAVGELPNLLAREQPRTEPASQVDARWGALKPEESPLAEILRSDVSTKLRAFREVNPLVVELLVADAQGRLVAATEKTSDYDQSDETWWQKSMDLRPGEALLEGLAMDQSAGVFSLDIAIPIASTGGTPVGVLKAVVNVSPLFSEIAVLPNHEGAVGEVVGASGRVLVRLSDRTFLPSGEILPPETMEAVREQKNGWFITEWKPADKELVGFAPIGFLGMRGRDGMVSGDPSFVIVREPASTVLTSLRQRAYLLTVVGVCIIFVCAAAALYLVGRNFLQPLEVLENAAAALASTTGQVLHPPRPGQQKNAEDALAAVATIRTGDEIEEFAGDFQAMSARLMRYQEDLRREIAEKTAAIQSDLDMAREFQQAFLPRAYPEVPSASQEDPLTLNFQHVYQAAMSVSGDFFDIIKLDDSRAAVLIADVMGHGTRSALVTAILRALLQGLSRTASDPALFLALLNRSFYETMKQADQLIFASACFVVLDTKEKTLRIASAGHPSPYIGNRCTGQVEPLYGQLRENPALGLFPASDYHEFSRPLREEDVLLLYTDGIIEALNSEGEEFGKERLARCMMKHLDMDLASFTQATLEGVLQFTGYQPPSDDLCIVAVEVTSNRPADAPAVRRKALHETMVEL